VLVLVYQLLRQQDPLRGIRVLVATAHDGAWPCGQSSACIRLGCVGCMRTQPRMYVASVGLDSRGLACLPWLHVCCVKVDIEGCLAAGAGGVSLRLLNTGVFQVHGWWR
jgi:hypothetical protein